MTAASSDATVAKGNEDDEDPQPVWGWRVLTVLTSIGAPLLLLLSAGAVNRAVYGAVSDTYSPLYKAARLGPPYKAGHVDVGLTKLLDSQLKSAVLDRQLVIYLAIAAIVGVVAAVHRAAAHGSETRTLKTADFVGKCLALSAALIVYVGASVRFSTAGVNDYLPTGFVVIAGAVGLLVISVIWLLCWKLTIEVKKAKDQENAKAKAKDRDEARTVASDEAQAVADAVVRAATGRLALIGSLSGVVVGWVSGLYAAKTKG